MQTIFMISFILLNTDIYIFNGTHTLYIIMTVKWLTADSKVVDNISLIIISIPHEIHPSLHSKPGCSSKSKRSTQINFQKFGRKKVAWSSFCVESFFCSFHEAQKLILAGPRLELWISWSPCGPVTSRPRRPPHVSKVSLQTHWCYYFYNFIVFNLILICECKPKHPSPPSHPWMPRTGWFSGGLPPEH